MYPKLKDILDLLEKFAPERLAEEWDNPGLQVGSYSREIKKIFLALDPTMKSLASAFRQGAQMLLSHHPLIFSPISRLDVNVYPGNVIVEALKSKICVVAAHTNLDLAHGGINDILADSLGFKNVEILKESREMDNAGLGRIGDLPKPDKLSIVAKRVKEVLGTEKLKMVGSGNLQINRIAVVGGSGGNLVSLASEKGAQLLLTGDVSHHNALEAESLGIALLDGGHFLTEKMAFGLFAERLQAMIKEQGWGVMVEVDKEETDPMRYA
ncbi:MAG: Nif3-like dinuclear metal center hexameric protein [Desulfobacterales bacterium]|nr:Nif3-like dinuclear metal center hexameric protein [Desulfobacterales bacterium]